jgi:CheY-like chemotaxis protein
VTSLGGEISARSRDGGGTTFRVVLPGVPAVHAATPAPAAAVRRGAVLVVDDEPTVGVILTRVLRAHDVTTVMRGSEALALIAAERHFDVIFCDLMMPEMTGMELYEQLVQRYPAVAQRVVFISGGVVLAEVSGFLEGVPNERLEKPFDAATVRALVQRFVT